MEWLQLVYKVPAEPSRKRTYIWRQVRGLGAVYLQDGCCVLPPSESAEQALAQVAAKVREFGGEAILSLLTPAEPGWEERLVAALNRARDEEYEELLDTTERLEEEIARETRKGKFTFAALEEIEDEFTRLEQWLTVGCERPSGRVEAALHEQPGTDWDDQGRLVGFGLTLRATPHRFSFGGRTVFAWCASDALMIPIITGRSGVVESPCPATGQLITVEVTPERVERADTPGAVMSLVRPDRIEDVRTDVCVLGSFFASAEAATEWLARYPEGMVHSVEDDFRLHREVMEKIGWALATSSIG